MEDFDTRWGHYKAARKAARELQSQITEQEKKVTEEINALNALKEAWDRERRRRDALAKDLSAALIEEVKKN